MKNENQTWLKEKVKKKMLFAEALVLKEEQEFTEVK